MHKLCFSAAVLAASAAVIHCGAASDGDPSSSESDHTAGKATLHNVPYVWTDSDYATFDEATRTTVGRPALADDDPITVRLQAWTDLFADAVSVNVKKVTGKELLAPRPIVKVVNSAVPNAWVTPVATCAGGPLDLTELARPRSDRTPTSPALDAGSPLRNPGSGVPFGDTFMVVQSATGAGGRSCIDAKNWPSIDGARSFYNGLKTACRFDGKGSGLVAHGDRCTLAAGTNPAVLEHAALIGTSRYLHVTTKMVSMMSDERVIGAILAHELGHYYRAHQTGLGDYDYFYDQQTPPVAKTPKRTQDSDKLRADLTRFSSTVNAPRVDGAKISPRLRFVVSLLLELMARPEGVNLPAPAAGPARPPIEPSCTTLESAARPLQALAFGQALSREDEKSYLELESRFFSCAAKINVGTDGAAHLDHARLLDALHGFDPELLDGDGGRPPAGTLASMVEFWAKRMAPIEAEAAAFLKKVNDRHLGIYTTEEEADDFAMELLAQVGFSPKRHVEAWLELTNVMAADPDTSAGFAKDGIDHAACTAHYRDGWMKTGPAGKRHAVFVPLGTLDEPHHGFCYRLFNLSRELLAHEFVTEGALPTFSPAWSEIQHAAAQKASTPPVPPPVAPAAPLRPGAVRPIFDRY